MRDLTYSCMYWLMVEQIRNFLVGDEYRNGSKKPSMLYSSVLPAMISGSIISFATTPIDTLKTRLQSGVHIEGSMGKQLQSIYRKEGFTGIFAGVQQRVLRNTINSVIYLSLF